MATIFALLRSTTGIDFSRYKPNTLDRRIRRRMLLHELEQLDDYVTYLQAHLAEVTALYEEILIHVTSFFRDPEAFDLLKTRVFPTIVQNKSVEVPIRIWVAGCSTGEEVYSIAMCLLEFLAAPATPRPIQIFATDISEAAIAQARAGLYQENQMVAVSTERRQRFFEVLEDGRYQISKAVRELCVFARQNLGSDPPFSNLDLISCRNVLIYLGDALQKRIISLFHYSLNPTGFLLLGTAESVGQATDLFTLVEPKYRLYAKQLTTTRPLFAFPPSQQQLAQVSEPPKPAAPEGFDLQQTIKQVIVNHYAPTGVVIDEQMQVLQLWGDIDPYLKLVVGVANLNLFNLVRPGLVNELRAALYQAQRQALPVLKQGLRLEEGEQVRVVKLQVLPFQVPLAEDRRFLVLFEETPPASSSPVPVDLAHPQGVLEQQLALALQERAIALQERAATQEYLQSVIQAQEHSNQDLKVANEEILSSNEELQSTIEELGTAKEEIQATNEELSTTNEELRSRNTELRQVNNDLTNLLASINVPILMLTKDRRIRWFSPTAQHLFHFIPTDTGRLLSDISTKLNLPNLEPLLVEVLETLSVKKLEVQTQAGHWYTLRIRPYRTSDDRIDGLVLVLLDIDALKRSAITLEVARNYAEAIVDTVQVPLVVLEPDFRVNKANRAFYTTFQVAPPETAQTLLFDLGNGQWNIPGLRSRLEAVFANKTTLQNFEVEHQFEQIGQKTMLLNAVKLVEVGEVQRLLLSLEDITERQQFETERAQLLSQEQSARQSAEAANRAKDEFLSNLSHELRNPLNTILGWAQLLRNGQLQEADATRALAVMERSARAQAQLVDDMLDVARITSGKLQLNTRRLDLVSVVAPAIESVQLAAAAKDIQLVAQLNSVTLLADPERLQQVLWNLLSNALKFTPTGGRVEISVEPVQAHVELRVSDTGQGIRAELLPYVFDRFRQGDSSTTKGFQGLGLGLSIVQYIVELHGGTVRAESPGEGQGTTIIVRLPLRPLALAVTPASEPAPTAALALGEQGQPPLAGLAILVVDDDVDSLDLLQYLLANAGADVVAVTSARDAMVALTTAPGKYDVLLADIGMPDEDGLALIRQVRALDAAAGGQLPAAAITAYVNERERQLALDAGFQRHMAKPLDPTQLVGMVAQMVGRGGRA